MFLVLPPLIIHEGKSFFKVSSDPGPAAKIIIVIIIINNNNNNNYDSNNNNNNDYDLC